MPSLALSRIIVTLRPSSPLSDLTAVAAASSGWDSDGSEKSQGDEDSHKPYAGYRRTDSFDR